MRERSRGMSRACHWRWLSPSRPKVALKRPQLLGRIETGREVLRPVIPHPDYDALDPALEGGAEGGSEELADSTMLDGCVNTVTPSEVFEARSVRVHLDSQRQQPCPGSEVRQRW